MATTSPTPVLTDDHIDLLITAAADWRLLASPTTAAFAQSALERHVVVASSTEAGRMLRAENTAAVRWLSDHGRTRLVDRAPAGPYTHHPGRDHRPGRGHQGCAQRAGCLQGQPDLVEQP
jgi:hypothetical protein